jgi:hypothetical protein
MTALETRIWPRLDCPYRCCRVNGHTYDIPASDFYFASVWTRAQRQICLLRGRSKRHNTANGSTRRDGGDGRELDEVHASASNRIESALATGPGSE